MGDGAQTNCHLSFTIWLHLAVCRTIDANATSMWYGKWVPQLSAVYLRNYWFWTGGFRVHKGGRVGIQLFCWHSRQIVQNLTLKKKVVVTWNTRANSKLMWSTTVQQIASLFAVLNFFIKPNTRSRWWQMACKLYTYNTLPNRPPTTPQQLTIFSPTALAVG